MSYWDNHSVLESRGDYQDDTILESRRGKDGGVAPSSLLYQNQSSLPLLPVPTLADTIDRFLPTALPLAATEDEATSLQRDCQDFLTDALPLQQRLLERAEGLKTTSWLQQWWNTLGYLQVRDPVVINVSYFFQIPNDTSLVIVNDSSGDGGDASIQRAAAAICATRAYAQRVLDGTHPPDTIGKQQTPLCSASYKYLFHACRIPQSPQDTYRIYNPQQHPHAIVSYQNQFYKVPLHNNNEQGRPLTVQEMETCLRSIVSRNRRNTQSGGAARWLELGYLTSSNRDDWAKARQELLQFGGQAMEDALTTIESGLVLLCLDEHDDKNDIGSESHRQRALRYWHGNASGNRWYDKSIQLVVSNNGQLGYVGEHSMMDGMPTLGLVSYLQRETYHKQLQEQQDTEQEGPLLMEHEVTNVLQEVMMSLSVDETKVMEGLVDKAKTQFRDLVDAHELHVESFHGYGANFIKEAGFSPDAYVQMAIQVASYRLFGKQVGTYESAQVRPFLHGRTETARSVSKESHAFVRAMGWRPDWDQKDGVRETKRHLLEEATKSHVRYIRKALQGQGVDRHFFGLSMMVEEGETAPALLSNPLFCRSKHWRLSTSTLPGTTPGFGPVVPDGVGIGYDIQPHYCIFTVTGRKEHGWTDRLCQLLEEALLELQFIADGNGSAMNVKSKL